MCHGREWANRSKGKRERERERERMGEQSEGRERTIDIYIYMFAFIILAGSMSVPPLRRCTGKGPSEICVHARSFSSTWEGALTIIIPQICVLYLRDRNCGS